jgi:quercetin dioxygenase-like cupin family protein
MHSHDAAQILIVLEGEEHHEIDGEKFILKAGDVAVHPPRVMHGGHP